MKYYVKCNSVFNRNEIEFKGEDDLLYFTIRHAKLPKIYGLDITDEMENKKYKVNYNPLRFKKIIKFLVVKVVFGRLATNYMIMIQLLPN